ncbi:CHAD domain-containing protein [Streptomyces sp. 1222.5]|uniref:CYTH and CHAD domain-containing protein n=1 Tax=Streptomyces sp. 1222.5 TaxID=1881026 RepID=UPI003D725ECC
MTQFKQELERKYIWPTVEDSSWLYELTNAVQTASLTERRVQDLDAVYYDTSDLRLARTGASLGRRTGGSDAGWHVKLPLPDGSREEVRVPLTSREIPDKLQQLLLSRTRGAALRPVIRIRSRRSMRHLLDAKGAVLAELSLDVVDAKALVQEGGQASWTELEVELAEGGSPALLDDIEKVLRKNGLARAPSPSKVVRALMETTSVWDRLPDSHAAVDPGSAGEQVLIYAERLVDALVDLHPAVCRDLTDSVHQMRTTARRLRGCLASYRSVFDREVTEPIRRDLRWLAGELGAERDHEVLEDRLASGVRKLPRELVLGPVTARLQVWDTARRAEGRQRTLRTLASPRYVALLGELRALIDTPPLRAKAAAKPRKVMVKALGKEYDRLLQRMERVLGMSSGPERDVAVHDARKAAKRLRYAAEAADATLKKPARRLGKRARALQQVSGAHHDSVVARGVLRRLGIAAHAAGQPSFTWGVLFGREMAAADAEEGLLPASWDRVRAAAQQKALRR